MDVKTRTAPKQPPKTEDEKLDDALGDTFPASDPPAMTEPGENVRIKKPPKGEIKKP